MRHTKLKKDWVYPTPPAPYNKAMVILGSSGDVRLDFIAQSTEDPTERPLIFSVDAESAMPLCEWPWIEGYTPKEEDWRRIGFAVTRVQDSFLGLPHESTPFQDWLHKKN